MDILIDGYNLLHQSPYLMKDRGKGWVHKARLRLLEFIATHQPLAPLAITVVFDASRGVEHSREEFRGIEVLFANDHNEADDLIEELIRKHSHPQSLTVVSSDHRIQTIANRRHANPIDSEIWIDRWSSRSNEDPKSFEGDVAGERRSMELTEEEKQRWLDEFGF